MNLLVSVSDAAEAADALNGGADIIDAKDPTTGALGAVPLDVFRAIHATVAGARSVSAALGDAEEDAAIERTARAYARAGASFVKIGFDGTRDAAHVRRLIEAAVRGAADGAATFHRACGVIAARYADRRDGIPPDTLVDVAARAGAVGLLLDTAGKNGPGLRELIGPAALASWVATAHAAGLVVALAGKLTAGDLAFACDAGADIAGVRGAACVGGRTGRVVAEKVAALKNYTPAAAGGSSLRTRTCA